MKMQWRYQTMQRTGEQPQGGQDQTKKKEKRGENIEK